MSFPIDISFVPPVEFILQQFLYRAGHHVDFSGLVRQGGVTLIGSDTVNDQAIWTVYLMIFNGEISAMYMSFIRVFTMCLTCQWRDLPTNQARN